MVSFRRSVANLPRLPLRLQPRTLATYLGTPRREPWRTLACVERKTHSQNPSSNRLQVDSIRDEVKRSGGGQPTGFGQCLRAFVVLSRTSSNPRRRMGPRPRFPAHNGMTHRFQSPKIPTRFRWAPHSCSGLRGTSPREGRRWRRAATIKALAPNPTVVDCQRVEAMSCAEREPKGSTRWSESRYGGPGINGQSPTGRAYV